MKILVKDKLLIFLFLLSATQNANAKPQHEHEMECAMYADSRTVTEDRNVSNKTL